MLQTISQADQFIYPLSDQDPTSLVAQVGNTPLLQLKRIADKVLLPPSVQLFAKAEWFNPSGSVKDRPALNIIRTAIENGSLKPGMTLLDSTSGNMGISYAMFGAAAGYRVRLTIPENASKERIAIMKAHGADLIFTDPLEGSDGALHEARRLFSKAGLDYFYANQYDNPANWQAHYYTTANEIWSQTYRQVTHFVAGMGTSGTFMGTSRRLKELNPSIHCISMQPDSPFNGLEGLKHLPTSIKPGIYEPTIADSAVEVKTEDAYEMARELAVREGLFVGFSAAAAIVAAIEVASHLSSGLVVTVLPDSGQKYLSERFWTD
jgi:cysteine synthase B